MKGILSSGNYGNELVYANLNRQLYRHSPFFYSRQKYSPSIKVREVLYLLVCNDADGHLIRSTRIATGGAMNRSAILLAGYITLSGCDAIESSKVETLEKVPPAVIKDGKVHELTPEGYRALSYLPPLQFDLSDRKYERKDNPPGLDSSINVSYFEGVAHIVVEIKGPEVDGEDRYQSWQSAEKRYSAFGLTFHQGEREVKLSIKQFDDQESSFADEVGIYGKKYKWTSRMSPSEYSSITGAQISWFRRQD